MSNFAVNPTACSQQTSQIVLLFSKEGNGIERRFSLGVFYE